ncbi:MAG: LacI family DNA-binding transcriptional regulator [Saprospiraceae bacterium]|nr:LacI family DNA-binding transcriptional regulator [Saprospiraceae bacterium]
MNRINIKELAKMLSLNPSTVSRALSDHPDISAATIKRVKDAAIEFNYIPNLHARYFRKKSSGLLALILPEFNMFFTHSLMNGIHAAIEHTNYSLIVFFSNNNKKKEVEIIQHCLSWAVDGILMSVSFQTENADHILQLQNAQIPVVLLDKVIVTENIPTVTINDREAAYNATRNLIDNGKKNILGIFANPSLDITQKRKMGFEDSLRESSIQINEYDTVYVNNPTETVGLLEKKLRNTPYNGVFIMSDELLMHSYHVLRKLNLYPNQISITAISDGILPYQLYPAITHIKHSGYEIGNKAGELLLMIIENKPDLKENIIVKTNLVELHSVSL